MRTGAVTLVAAATLGVAAAAAVYLVPQPLLAPVGQARAEAPATRPVAAPATPATPEADPATAAAAVPASVTPRPTSPPPVDRPRRPLPVSDISLVHFDEQTFTLGWRPSNTPTVVGYVVLLDGRQVAQPGPPLVTLAWPLGSQSLLIQVAAVADDGLKSEWRAIVLVPPAEPVAAPSPTPTPVASSPRPAPSTPPASSPPILTVNPPPSPSPSASCTPAPSASSMASQASAPPTPPQAITVPTITATASSSSSAAPSAPAC